MEGICDGCREVREFMVTMGAVVGIRDGLFSSLRESGSAS